MMETMASLLIMWVCWSMNRAFTREVFVRGRPTALALSLSQPPRLYLRESGRRESSYMAASKMTS